MSYYDFDYFWTHEEVGGKKSKVIKKAKKLDLITTILNFIPFAIKGSDQTNSKESDQSIGEHAGCSNDKEN